MSKIDIDRVRKKKKSLYIHVVVLLLYLPSLDGKLEHFVTKKWKKLLPNTSQTDYRISYLDDNQAIISACMILAQRSDVKIMVCSVINLESRGAQSTHYYKLWQYPHSIKYSDKLLQCERLHQNSKALMAAASITGF